jgi:large subunit ribosomal protein L15
MKLHTLKPANGSVKSSKRIGRGPGSGMGGTSTRGHKGAKSRSGYKSKIGFEGGQMPLQRRIPKFGFKSLNRVEFKPVNLDTLAELISTSGLSAINPENLFEHGLISKNDLIKVLSRGDVKVGVEVKAHAFSASAVQAIESAGGKAIVIE